MLRTALDLAKQVGSVSANSAGWNVMRAICHLRSVTAQTIHIYCDDAFFSSSRRRWPVSAGSFLQARCGAAHTACTLGSSFLCQKDCLRNA